MEVNLLSYLFQLLYFVSSYVVVVVVVFLRWR